MAHPSRALVAELPSGVDLVTAPRGRVRRIAFLRALVRNATVLLQFGDGRLYPSIRPALGSARAVLRFCHSDYSHLRTRSKNLADRLLAHGEDQVIAVGGRSTRFLLDDVGMSSQRVTTLSNAMEPRTTTTAQAAPWPWMQEPYFVAVQSLYPHKGHDALLRAFAGLARGCPHPVRLVVIGDGDQTIPLHLLADSLGIRDRVVWLGGLWHRDIVDTVLSPAVGFVSMSRFEGIPVSILEARAHGLPLVLTDIPGHRDGAGSSPAAFTAVDDVDAFADHLRRQLDRHLLSPTHDRPGLDEDWRRDSEDFPQIVGRAGARPARG